MIRNRQKFFMGLVGLLIFLIGLSLWVIPLGDRESGLGWADTLFNELAKDSAYAIPLALKRAEKFRGLIFDLAIDPRSPGADTWVAKIAATNGMSALALGDGRVQVNANLGRMSLAASKDADLLFKGQEKALRDKYGLSGKEVIYYWWVLFEDLTRSYIQLKRPSEADFTKFVTTRVLEPSYNFAGIESRSISQNIGTVVLLLAFYVFYTVWYGFSILFLFEGLGIGATKATEKKEA